MTALDLGGWISICFGIGLIRTSFPCSRSDGAEDDSRGWLAASGYCLLVIGALILGIGMFHPFH